MQDAEYYADVYDNKKVKARKPHVCCACKDTIPAGDYYHCIFVACWYEKAIDHYKRCLRCEAIHSHLVAKLGNNRESWPAERLDCGETYEDAWDESPPPEIAELAFKNGHEMQHL